MEIGVVVPQGWTGEYDGWDPPRAWERTLAVTLQAERLGFESAWVFDHFHTEPEPTDELTFESFTTLAALAASTERLRLGQVVICTAFRNPALTAKMIGTLDVISGGRMELGIGAGWKEDEWIAYGYGFPPVAERLAILADYLEIITRMLGPGRATWAGEHAHVIDAIHEPKGLQQPRIPILIGGNGPKVTWRLAARFADELNLDALAPEDVERALPVIAQRCEEVGRDPSTLRVSIHMWGPAYAEPGTARRQRLRQYMDLGLDRAILQAYAAVQDPPVLDAIADDCAALGLLESVPAS